MSDEGGGSIGRFAAILGATIALLGALVGNLQLSSSADGAAVGRRASQLENQQFGSQVPMKRPAQPCELAPVYVMLASGEASYVSGATVAVTGGKPIL